MQLILHKVQDRTQDASKNIEIVARSIFILRLAVIAVFIAALKTLLEVVLILVLVNV